MKGAFREDGSDQKMKRILSGLFVLMLALCVALGAVGCGADEINGIPGIVDPVVNQTDTVSGSDSTDNPSAESPESSGSSSPETAPETTAPGTSAPETRVPETTAPETDAEVLPEDGAYTSKDDVALYIHTYGHLPSNFITKSEARKLGWSGGSLESYARGCSIGGDTFGNREGLLPAKKGRVYTECDIDTAGKSSRGAKRIVFSNDGLIYYTDDHYESFALLYGEE